MKPTVDSPRTEKPAPKPLVIKVSQKASLRDPMPCTWVIM